jgi:hypothetical protein
VVGRKGSTQAGRPRPTRSAWSKRSAVDMAIRVRNPPVRRMAGPVDVVGLEDDRLASVDLHLRAKSSKKASRADVDSAAKAVVV